MRVFFNVNVLFSASNAQSNVRRLVELVFREHTVVTSDFAWEEARRNVEVRRPDWLDGFAAMAGRIEVVSSVLVNLPVELEEKDRPILCAAIRSGCVLLATGDRKHFGHLYGQSVAGVTVVTLLELAQRLA